MLPKLAGLGVVLDADGRLVIARRAQPPPAALELGRPAVVAATQEGPSRRCRRPRNEKRAGPFSAGARRPPYGATLFRRQQAVRRSPPTPWRWPRPTEKAVTSI